MGGAEVAGAGRVEGVAAKVGGWNPFEDTVSFGAVTEDFIFGEIIRVFPLFMKLESGQRLRHQRDYLFHKQRVTSKFRNLAVAFPICIVLRLYFFFTNVKRGFNI